MATLKHADSKKNMYSWWWNSHISPKNSKWLQENLTDMDVKVKSMIKLIEEDADSFARRAEMYYKKRPELMKLVEEFYRAYRALAERYDHATGALRQAHQTMAEAFPNQIPMNPDDSPANSETDPRTGEMSTPTRAMFESENLQKDASGRSSSPYYGGKRNGAFSEESEGRVRKGLNFNMAEEDGAFSQSKQGGKMEKEILSLKDSLAKFEAEKEAALIQYEESLERLSKLGLEVALAQRKLRETTERAIKAEAEAQALKVALARLEAEKEGSLLQYQECLARITALENDLSRAKEDNAQLDERARGAENEAESLKQQLAKLDAEKDAALDQYNLSLKMISDLEEKLRQVEEDARNCSERAEKAEGEVEILKQMIAKLTEEKEAEGVLYQQCLKTIASLEHKLLLAQEEAERLNGEIDDGVAKLKGAEEQCVMLEKSNQSLHAELESMVIKMGNQSQELTEKQKELGRLWSSIQEERLRFVEAETAFQTLQHLHSQAQEELRSLDSELQNRALILKDMETRNQSLQDEILSYKEENKHLNELNLASATLTKDMRDEIFSLKESKGKLEGEIDLRTDQRNALQQEIYCLKEELKELNRKHRVVLEQVDAVGLNPEYLGSSVKELQDDNLNLKEVCQRERSERLALLEKLEIMLEKNVGLESSLSDLQEEILKCKEENKNLNELNLASATLTKDMCDEIFSLKESKEKVEEELERRVDQGNALQLEINSLKEELNELNRKHRIILEQVDAVGLKPESIGSSVKELQDENSNLKEVSQREKSERLALLEKLEIMGQLVEKNVVLENSLSDLSAELEGVRGKLKVIEDSCRLLLEEKSALADEKASLMEQLRVTTEDLEKLSEKNSVMENSLSDAHAELDLLKSKSKSLEDSCQLLTVEKSALITDKGSLVSEIEITQEGLKDLKIRYAELEEKCSAVERERASTLSRVDELERSLAVQKQEHDRHTHMHGIQLAGMEGRILQLKEEGMKTRKEFEEELDKSFSLQTETFILVRCIQDLEEKNVSLVNDFQKLMEASKSSEKLICVLEQDKAESQVTIKSLSDHINALRAQLHQLLIVFDIGTDREYEDKNGHDQTCLNHILSKAEHTKQALFETEDESRQLAVEVSILVTLLRQLRTELANLESEKNSLDQELAAKSEKLLELQGKAHKLQERNEELGLKLIEGEQKEEVLAAQIDNLREELLEVHGAYGNLQAENREVGKEKMVLMKELSDVEGRVHAVEGQNSIFIDELYEQSIFALVLKNYLEEKSVAICGLGEDLDKLNGVNSVLLEKLTLMERELEGVQAENQDLKETLQKSEHELQTVAIVSTELNCEILNVKNSLGQKEREFSEAEEKLKLTENEKTELYGIVEDLKREYDVVKMTSEEQGKRILELSDTNNRLSEEQISLQEASQMLELELHQLREEHEKTISELEKEKNGVEVLESHAEAIYGEMQTSSIYEALLVLKVRELAEAFVSLQEEKTSKDMTVEALEEKAASLESESGSLKSQLASYGSALVSLRDCIVSLENRTCPPTEAQMSNEDVKGAELVNDRSVEDSDEVSDFLDLQDRVKKIENSVIELERLRMLENTDANTKLESLTRQMEELKLQRSYHKGERKPTSEILEVGTKDIVLDQESESSSHEKSKREGENPMLELWETTYRDGSIDLTVGKSKRIAKPKGEEMLVEKELGVDKLEISKRFKEPRVEGNKQKVLERLNSDDQKLTNLQITVQDLKKKVEVTEKGQRGKAVVECDTLKAQLEEAEAAIQKLFDLTAKLMKNIEDSSFAPEKNAPTELDESKSTRRTRTSEQARRISEKIGRLQLEVQKIQFALLKLDDDKESKGKSRYLDTKRRVLLKDYLYGGGRTKATIHRKTKAPFCACMDPPISD